MQPMPHFPKRSKAFLNVAIWYMMLVLICKAILSLHLAKLSPTRVHEQTELS